MRHRSLPIIVLLNIVTFGLYEFYWYYVTKTELNVINKREPNVPLYLWFFISPINLWWWYRLSKSLNKATKGDISVGLAFFLPLILLAVYVGLVYLLTGQQANISYVDPIGIVALVSTYYIPYLITTLYFQHKLNKIAK